MEHINKIGVNAVNDRVRSGAVNAKASTGLFIDKLHENTHKTTTENGAVTLSDSGSALLNFYAQAGAMRKNPDKALELFKKAFGEDRQSAIRILFYLRDVRGGQGERDLFRKCLEWIGVNHVEVFEQIIQHVSEYGRWDDLFFDNEEAIEHIALQLKQDTDSETPSLLAKWMPTINASSKVTRAKARWFAEALGMSDIQYRHTIRNIRKVIKTVEEKMSAKQWEDVDYSSVPSQASRIYRNAFRKHDEARYDAFIGKAEKGEVKINASTLYPYQIYESVQRDYSKTLEALWNQLPDYTMGKNALVVADVSGSMCGTPMSVSVSLALYFAERNQGYFEDTFISFSGNPTLQKVRGATLQERMHNLEQTEWDMNTDLQAVFDLVLDTAVDNNIDESEMPETIYIISDMEFDSACDSHTNMEVIKAKYLEAGFKCPNLVFWNVDARSGENLPARHNEQGVALVSGLSPVVFKMAVENKSSIEVMEDTINSERYARIII